MNNKIDCTREGEENSRVRGALEYAYALAGGKMESCSGIVRINDHKGELEVQWGSEYSHNLYKQYINRAWYEFANEPHVSHFLVLNEEEHHLSGVNFSCRKVASSQIAA